MVCGTQAARPDRLPNVPERRLLLKAGGSIAYYRFGQGSPIVLVAGYRATLSEWNTYFLEELARHHEVVVFDNRGVGRSVGANDGYRVQDLAADTISLITGLKLQDVTLLGWSMGGMIAQQAVEQSPGIARRLILLATMPPGREAIPVPPYVMEALSRHDAGSFDRIMALLFPKPAVAQAEKCFAKEMFLPKSYASAEISEPLAQRQARLMEQWQADNAAAAGLRNVTIPTLVLGGTDDRILAPKDAVELKGLLPDAMLDEVTGGGHAVMYQFPFSLADRITHFIVAGR
ncbi:MAG: alpha/beta fold hydrolase [Vulcanimicrobiaceae bacterium]